MEINSLTIANFRGIKGEFEIEPEGDNVVLVGPNGSGKSSVIAALDYLFTSSLQELSGKGTGGISKSEHAPHVDADPSEAWVEAKIVVEDKEITIRRCLEDNNLQMESESEHLPETAEVMMDVADRGLHLLSRDEILDFITSTGGRRSERIRKLLDLQNIKERRLALQNATSNFESTAERLKREVDSQEKHLFELWDIEKEKIGEEKRERVILQRINKLREELSGDKIETLEKDFRRDIEPPSEQVAVSPLLKADGHTYIRNLNEWTSTKGSEFLDKEKKFRKVWESIDADKEAIEALERQQLITAGLSSLETNEDRCPLCHDTWDGNELEEYLELRLNKAEELEKEVEEIEPLRDELQDILTEIRMSASSLLDIVRGSEFNEDSLREFVDTVESWEDGLEGDLLEEPPKYKATDREREELLIPQKLDKFLTELQESLKERDIGDLQEKWDKLNVAEDRYRELKKKIRQASEYSEIANDMRETKDMFLETRDEALRDIYSDIESDFEEYYRSLHRDERDMSVELEPSGAGLSFEVEFYGRNDSPPHALHSEGHQDSMGICLYFALCNWMSASEELSVMMLDDVVMSIDENHRRPLADLLANEISDDYQMFITTHDDLWHHHLRSAGVVSSSNVTKFQGWSINDGPKVMDKPETEWDSVYQLLEEGKVSRAAQQTRRMSEWYLREVCRNINGRVEFKSNSRWTLGDFKQGVESKYLDLLKKSKSAEQSWGKDIDWIEEIEEEARDILDRIDNEGKALNPNVHWNESEEEFAQCTPEELRPAVEAYHDFYDLLSCDTCGSFVKTATQGNEELSLGCRCGEIHFNLEEEK